MSRNIYPGRCYVCGQWTPTGYGHFERYQGHWRVKCVKCASGRDIGPDDPGVHWAENQLAHRQKLAKRKSSQ